MIYRGRLEWKIWNNSISNPKLHIQSMNLICRPNPPEYVHELVSEPNVIVC